MSLRTTSIVSALALPLVLVLAGCGGPIPAGGDGGPSSAPSTDPSASSEPSPSAAGPVTINAADYLVEHEPASDNSNELFHYAFFTDDQKAVRCDLHIGGQSDPFGGCYVVPGAEALVTYHLPAGTITNCGGGNAVPQLDGFELYLDGFASPPGYAYTQARIQGCPEYRTLPPGIAGTTLVMPNGGVLDADPFRCEVVDAVATCSVPGTPGSITLGVSQIGITN